MTTFRRKSDWGSLFTTSTLVNGIMGRRERRTCETRERIFRAAMNLFRDHGFQKTTVENITEAADVGKGTFFNYFPTKEHVLGVLGEIQLDKYDHAMRMAQAGDAQSALHWLYRALPAEVASSPEMVRSLVTVFMTSEEVRTFLTAGLQRGRGKLGDIFQTAVQRAEIPAHHKPAALAFRFQQSTFGAMVLWTLQTPAPPMEEWLDAGFDFFWAAVTARPEAKNRTALKQE